jgi:cytochrome P450
MSNTSKARQVASFAAHLYRERAAQAVAGYVRRDPMALLDLRAGLEDPYALYERMRPHGPFRSTRTGELSSVSYAVCETVVRSRKLGPQPEKGLEDGLSFLTKNPPDHTRLRKLASPAFTPRAVAGYEGKITAVIGQLLDAAAADGEFDLVSQFAAPLPITVISGLLGVPDPDVETFARVGGVVSTGLDGVRSLRHAAELQAGGAELGQMFTRLFEQRRREPADDLISHLLAAEGEQIQPDELVPICVLLLLAGFETTMNLIASGVLALLGHPDQWAALCADPVGLSPAAVEETLRYDPPVQIARRVTLEPLEIGGRELAAGQWIIALLGAAGRDPAMFDRPAEFDLHRPNADAHLAFAAGIHYCLGQSLARLEGAIALRMLAERMPGLARAGAVTRRPGATIRGPVTLPVTAGPPRRRTRLAARTSAGRGQPMGAALTRLRIRITD